MVHILDGSDQNTVRTCEVSQIFRLVEGIWLHRQRGPVFFYLEKMLFHMCATCSEVPSTISTMNGRLSLGRSINKWPYQLHRFLRRLVFLYKPCQIHGEKKEINSLFCYYEGEGGREVNMI